MLYNEKWTVPEVVEISDAASPWSASGLSDADINTFLLRAARILEEEGWCQHSAYHGYSSCLVGAMSKVVYVRVSCTFIMDKAIAKMGFSCRAAAVLWNDNPGRTKEEVIARLKEAAAG